MAIVLPVFMVLMFGIVELGRAFMVGQLVSNASREGARLSILDGQTNTSVSNAVRNFLQQSAGTRPADVNVTITVNSATAGNQVASSQAGDLITVTVAVPFSKVSFFPPMFLGSSSLRATCTMQRE
jgi:Flp pilus assembly protein TadG